MDNESPTDSVRKFTTGSGAHSASLANAALNKVIPESGAIAAEKREEQRQQSLARMATLPQRTEAIIAAVREGAEPIW